MGPWRLGLGLRAGVGVTLLGFVLMVGSAAADPTTFTWSGASTSSSDFSDASNWSGTGPTTGANEGAYLFQALDTTACPPGGGTTSACYQADDDLTGASFDSISLSGTGYMIGGADTSAEVGSGGITEDASGGALSNEIALPLEASAAQTWELTGDGTSGSALLDMSGALTGDDVTVSANNGAELELSNSGDTAPVTFAGDAAASSALLISGNVGADLSVSDATVQLENDNTLGPFIATGSNVVIGQTGSAAGGATTAADGSVSATGGTLTFEVDGGASGTEPEAAELNASAGGLALNNSSPQLVLNWVGGGNCPAFADDSIGVPLTLVSGSVTGGTFSGVPDGTLVTLNCNSTGPGDPQPEFEINYTASAITATPVSASTTTLVASPDSTASVPIDQPVTLTATVAQGLGTGLAAPSGAVRFDENGTPITGCESQPLTLGSDNTNATATCAIPLGPGDSAQTVVADYLPSNNANGYMVGLPSSSSTQLPTSTPDATDTTLLGGSNPLPGAPVQLSAYVSPVLGDSTATLAGSYTIPSGAVVFEDDGNPITCQGGDDNMLNGIGYAGAAGATCTTSFATAGVHQITVSYAGDPNYFTGSSVMQSISVGIPTAMITAPYSGESGETYSAGATVQTAFSCSDPYGLASCTDSNGASAAISAPGNQATGGGVLDTCQSGTFTYTVTAKSQDGATATATITYSVQGTAPTGTCGIGTGGGSTGGTSGGNTGGAGGSGGGSGGSGGTGGTGGTGSGTVKTGSVKTGSVKVSGNAATVALSCTGGASGTVTLELTAQKVVGSGKHRKTIKVIVGKAVTTLASGAHRTVKLKLNAGGQQLLKKIHTLHATLQVTQTAAGKSRTLTTKRVVFRAAKR